MKSKIKNIKSKFKNENGLVIVEAAIVFPVMFFVLFFIIFIGNTYFEQAKVDEIVLTQAIKGATAIADPFQNDMEQTGSISTNVSQVEVQPYRYVLGSITNGSISKIETAISKQVKSQINDNSYLFFSNSKANIVGTDNKNIATFKNYLVYSTFIVQVNYEVKFPIKFLGEENPTIITLSSRAEVPVSDTAEFIRNVDMVVDLLEGNSVVEQIKDYFGKINEFIGKFS